MAEKKKFDLSTLGVPIGAVKSDPTKKSSLYYGPPGSGKTRLAASTVDVAELSPVILVDFEDGTASIENLYADNENLSVIRPSNWLETKRVLEALLNEDHGYKTIILDTVGKMMEFMEIELDKKASKNAFEKWASLAADTLHFIEELHRSGLNVIALAHVDSDKDDTTGKVSSYPYFLGRKTGKEAPKVFDVIGYMYVEEVDGAPVRVLQTEGITGVTAKDRTDTLPVLLGNPTMRKMFDYFKSGVVGKGRTKDE